MPKPFNPNKEKKKQKTQLVNTEIAVGKFAANKNRIEPAFKYVREKSLEPDYKTLPYRKGNDLSNIT